MQDYICGATHWILTTAFTSIFSLPWELHEAVLYIACFAIRNNNNLFYRFSKNRGKKRESKSTLYIQSRIIGGTWLEQNCPFVYVDVDVHFGIISVFFPVWCIAVGVERPPMSLSR